MMKLITLMLFNRLDLILRNCQNKNRLGVADSHLEKIKGEKAQRNWFNDPEYFRFAAIYLVLVNLYKT